MEDYVTRINVLNEIKNSLKRRGKGDIVYPKAFQNCKLISICYCLLMVATTKCKGKLELEEATLY